MMSLHSNASRGIMDSMMSRHSNTSRGIIYNMMTRVPPRKSISGRAVIADSVSGMPSAHPRGTEGTNLIEYENSMILNNIKIIF